MVYAGIRNSDGLHVALKHVSKAKIFEYGQVSKESNDFPNRSSSIIARPQLYCNSCNTGTDKNYMSAIAKVVEDPLLFK